MPFILVHIDFTASSENAMNYAAELAHLFGASIFLLHIYQLPVTMDESLSLMIPLEEYKKNADDGVKRAMDLLKKNYPALDVRGESRLGDIYFELQDVCKQINPEIIVSGKHPAENLERFFLADMDVSIVTNSPLPVLIIPETSGFLLNKVLLAYDGTANNHQVTEIIRFISIVKSSFHILHIISGNNNKSEANAALFKELSPVFNEIESEDFIGALRKYILENNIDLLLILPHKHNLIDRLFFKNHTKQSIEKLDIPILCIPQT